MGSSSQLQSAITLSGLFRRHLLVKQGPKQRFCRSCRIICSFPRFKHQVCSIFKPRCPGNLFHAAYLASMAIINGARSTNDVFKTIRAGFWSVIRISWVVSPLGMVVAQKYIPLHVRLTINSSFLNWHTLICSSGFLFSIQYHFCLEWALSPKNGILFSNPPTDIFQLPSQATSHSERKRGEREWVRENEHHYRPPVKAELIFSYILCRL